MRSLKMLLLMVVMTTSATGAATFTVNNIGDQPDASTADNLCSITGSPTTCTLRAAIQQANATAGTDTIAFNIPSTGPHLISPASALPGVTQAVTLDGTTEPDYVQGSPSVVIRGTGAGAGTNGLVFAAGSNGSTLRGVVIQSFVGTGVVIQSDNCVMERTYVGTNAGTSAAGNGGAGVSVSGNSNTLGVANDGAKRILVSANGGGGIILSGNSNTLQFSYVGTNLAGTAALGNTGSGITISGSSNTLIQNIVSGNTQDGIRITAGSGNVVRTNHLIGLNNLGTTAIPNGGNGVNIQGGTNNTIGPFNVISGNTGNGVSISGLSTTGNIIKSNFIGTTLAGTAAMPNGQAGVLLSTTASNTIGGTAVGTGNVISGNTGIGVRVLSGNGNFIQSNVIGANPAGTGAIGNGSHGIYVEGSSNTTIGNVEGSGNLVSGNGGSGIFVTGAGSTGLKITANTIGSVVNGASPLPNAVDGITLTNVNAAVIGGGTFVGDDNEISGNGRHGIYISGGSGNQIKVNEIGVDGTGTAAVGNTGHGIFLENTSGATVDTSLISANHLDGVRISGGSGHALLACIIGLNVGGTGALGNLGNGVSILNSPNNIIGQSIAGKGNTISGNLQSGVVISGASSTGNVIRNTLIGPNISDNANLGNGGWGVLLSGGSNNNTFGGTLAGDSNRIRANGLGGIGVLAGTSNTIQRNLISSNLGLGIDLDADGAPFDGLTVNDPGDGDLGANDLQNRPVITAATINAGSTTLNGTLSSTPNTNFQIEIFGNPRCDPSNAGEGTTILALLNTTTNGSGQATFSTAFGPVAAGTAFTATAIDPNGNTSEFSACFPIFSRAPIEFDGDPSSELFVFNNGAWVQYDYTSGAQVPGGSAWTGTAAGCRQAMMDFDGDGRDNFTQLCNGAWHFYNANGSYNKGIWVGNTPGNLPVPADYDGDGKDDVVLYNNGAWVFYDFPTATYQAAKSRFTSVAGSGQIPAPMDYDGDGKAEFTVYVGGAWNFFDESGSLVKAIWVGDVATFPVPGDYDGDGHDDVVVFHDGLWAFYDFATGAFVPAKSVFTGTPAHISGGTSTPEPLDVNGDGLMDRTIFAGGPWHFYNANGSYAKGIWTGGGGERPLSARPLQ